MLKGEAPNRRKLLAFVLAFVAGVMTVAALSTVQPDSSFLAAADVPAETTAPDVAPVDAVALTLERFSTGAIAVLESHDARLDVVDIDLAAAAASVLLLQGQLDAQASRIAALELAIAAADKPAEPVRRPRKKSVPDPPASSYLQLR